MSKKELCIMLSKLKVFEKADMKLEQHPTDSEIAGTALWEAFMQGDIKERTVADLGAGTGILGLGAALLEAKQVYMVDIDENALKIAKENQEWLKEETEMKLNTSFLNEDIANFDKEVDTVIMNPPFGTKEKNKDSQFLLKAMTIAPVIYTFHKATTKKYIDDLAWKNGYFVSKYKEYLFPLKKTMEHHKKKIERIKVGVWRLQKG